MAGGSTAIEKAIDLVKKATDADQDQKYEEALPLYQHALEYFLRALKYEACGERSKESIRGKCTQYLERAGKLEKFISKKNKTVHSSSGGTAHKETKKSLEVCPKSLPMAQGSTAMEKATDLVKKATDADQEQKYEEALPLYQHAIDYLLHSLKYEARDERSKESIRDKCTQYLKRAEELKKFISKKDKTVHSSSGGTAHKETKKSLEACPKSLPMAQGSTAMEATDLMKKATDADQDQKYEEALPLYEHAVDYFLHALKYEAHDERSKESIRGKCTQCIERTGQLEKFISKDRKVHSSSGGTAHKETKK